MTTIAPLPHKKYSVILADPPWTYKDKAHAGERGAEYKYDCLTLSDIINMRVASIAAENCALFLWATAPLIDEAITVLRGWSFQYKTIAFTWIKTSKNGNLAWGLGNYTRANPEYVLLGIKGRPVRLNAGVHSVVMAERREHSRKPDEVRTRIEALFGDVPRIELFARGEVPGWDVYGNEAVQAVTNP